MYAEPGEAPIGANAPLLQLDQSSEFNGNKPAPLQGFGWVRQGMQELLEEASEGREDEKLDYSHIPCFICEMAIAAPTCAHKVALDGMAREGATTMDPMALFGEMAVYAQEQIFTRAATDEEFVKRGFRCSPALVCYHYFMHVLDPQQGAANELRAVRALKWTLFMTAVNVSPSGEELRPEVDTVRMLQMLGRLEKEAFDRMHRTT